LWASPALLPWAADTIDASAAVFVKLRDCHKEMRDEGSADRVAHVRKRKATAWPWLSLAMSQTRLAMDAQHVIALRLAKLAAGGPKAQREALLMVTEKMKALADSQRLIVSATGRGKGDKAAQKVVGLYQRRVSANKKRLGKR
jgi:hypothetical protein